MNLKIKDSWKCAISSKICDFLSNSNGIVFNFDDVRATNGADLSKIKYQNQLLKY